MRNILFFGAKQHGVEVAKVLKESGYNLYVVYLIEEPHEKIYYEHLKDYAHKHNINTISSKEANSKSISAIIERENIDFLLFVKWRYIVEKKVVDKAEYGGFTIHDSLLPKYRGFAPLNWAIINGERETGITLLKINETVDGGPILAQKKIAIGENENVFDIEKVMVRMYKEIIRENISGITEEKRFRPQDEKKATYCCMRRPQDSKIKWDDSSVSIHNFIRALVSPFPCAFTICNNKKIEIIKAKVLSPTDKYVGRIPGRLLKISEKGVDVLTGEGVLTVEEVIVDGAVMRANIFFKTVKKKLEE